MDAPNAHVRQDLILKTPSIDQLQQWSRLHSASTHLAGDQAHAYSIQALWKSYGICTEISVHKTRLNRPGQHSAVRLLNPDSSVSFEASLTEDVLPADPASSIGPPAFHGMSFPGRVAAPLLYANFGRPEDFQTLNDNGISVHDKIVLCRYSGSLRGLKVRAAQEAGAAGVILYNDPQEDGPFTSENCYASFPDGPARHPSAIQRGSVSFFSIGAGPYPEPEFTPYIPSLSISFRDARLLLKALAGHGLGRVDLPPEWQGSLPGVEYFSGPSHLQVELVNDTEYIDTKLYNVIGTIKGETSECVVLGNHHDSWSAGCVDPVSGSAAMNEVVRSLGKALATGWKPLRTIILASWDGEEYGLLGSTAWAAQNSNCLRRNCIAYINVDESTNGGDILGPVGSPLLAEILYEAAKLVPSPFEEDAEVEDGWYLLDPNTNGSSSAHRTVYTDWLQNTEANHPSSDVPLLQDIGTGSDFTVFQHHLGISSADLVFNAGPRDAVYQYHTKYDSTLWMEYFGDPGYRKHKAMAQLWGLIAFRLASDPVLAFSATLYAMRLKEGFESMDFPDAVGVDGLFGALSRFHDHAIELDDYRRRLSERTPTSEEVSIVNTRYIALERGFMHPGGLSQRPWYKHLAFGPGLWEGYGGVAFPAIADAMLLKDIATIQAAVDLTKDAVDRVTNFIVLP
ncbi:hypothetical protein BJY01DRAFT_205924 [Aspergillus pseudoustus]|uniref:Peptidase M28 n=1 Tax=Aspergillus pseudoustus TaxID=1810923 RepID=A0ABR4KNK1_9EURO